MFQLTSLAPLAAASLSLLVCLPPAVSGQAPPAQERPSPKFSDYEMIQYITASGQGPENIIHLDNNGDVVLACRTGRTREELKAAGLTVSESQIELMKVYRVLTEKQKRLTVAFPMLGPEETAKLRQVSRTAAKAIGAAITPDVKELTGQLGAMGRQGNAYSILFSYIIDGLAWDVLEARGLVNAKQLTAASPLWAGEAWAVRPKRAFACGTNSIRDKGVSLVTNWSEAAIPKMAPFVTDWTNLSRLFGDYVAKGKVEHADARRVFGPFNLFDGEGRLTIPIIDEEHDAALHRVSRRIAERIADALPPALGLGSLVTAFGLRDEKQALVIAYHEVMWDLLEDLEGAALITKPTAFANPAAAQSRDIADLVFIVRGKR